MQCVNHRGEKREKVDEPTSTVSGIKQRAAERCSRLLVKTIDWIVAGGFRRVSAFARFAIEANARLGLGRSGGGVVVSKETRCEVGPGEGRERSAVTIYC